MWWILVVVLGLVVLALVPGLVLRLAVPGLERRVGVRHAAGDVVLKELRALYFGVASKGPGQVRGNGALVLTEHEIHWFQLVPEVELRIPAGDIVAAGAVRAHLGKAIGRDLLHISFRSGDTEDSVAWYVRDLAAWLSELATRRGQA